MFPTVRTDARPDEPLICNREGTAKQPEDDSETPKRVRTARNRPESVERSPHWLTRSRKSENYGGGGENGGTKRFFLTRELVARQFP